MQHDAHVKQFYKVQYALAYMRASIANANANLAMLRCFPWLCPVSG